MLLNYLKISLRYLLKNKTFSAINLFGLTLGFLSFLMVALYVHDELQYDAFHTDADQIYRVIQHERQDDGTVRSIAQVAPMIGPGAVSDLPGIQAMAWISVWGRITMGNDPANRHYQRLMPANANFLQVFDFPLKEGNPAIALTQPNAIIINEELAKRHFGNEPALGKQIWGNLNYQGKPVIFQVAGVLENIPRNSHLQVEMLISEATFMSVFPWYTETATTDWVSNDNVTYFKTRPGTDIAALEAKLTSLVRDHYPPDRHFRSTFTLQPIKEIHLSPDAVEARTEISASVTNPMYLYSFALVGVLLLLIACLNYLNLSTAAAFQRTREIGARKTLGAQPFQLIMQFCGEALILAGTSLLLAVTAAYLLLPAVNHFTSKELSLTTLPVLLMVALLLIMLIAGISSSFYPAFIIARIKPAEALKKDIRIGGRGLPVRKLVVAAQLAIAILMIASTLVVYRQLNFVRDKDLGIRAENLLVIDINSASMRDVEKVKSEFKSITEVQSVTASSRVPGEWKSFPIANVRNPDNPQGISMIYVGIDNDFLSTYEIKLLAGRNFVPGRADSLKVVLTRLAAEQLGLTDPLGQMIEIPSAQFGGNVEPLEQPMRVEVIGIVENFHFESFKQRMMPLIFAYHDNEIMREDYYTLRIQSNNWNETIAKLGDVYAKIESITPMEYNFLDAKFEEFYRDDEKRGQLFLFFSLEIVLIACLGLFALVSFSVERRTKEISIRKALGATVSSIVIVIASEFVTIIAIAAVVALPLAWYLMNVWLSDFVYRIALGPGVFALAVLLSILIAAITISFRTISAARANPVKWLRAE